MQYDTKVKKISKYPDTQSISSELMNLIKEAREKIILVTYSLQVKPQIQERLKTKSVNGRHHVAADCWRRVCHSSRIL